MYETTITIGKGKLPTMGGRLVRMWDGGNFLL